MAVEVGPDCDALAHPASPTTNVVVLDRDLLGTHGDEVCPRLAAEEPETSAINDQRPKARQDPKRFKAARELDAGALGRARESDRYERADDRELAAAIDVVSAHGCADELTGELERGHHGARVGRFVLWSDPQRVAALQTFANERAASMMLELGGLYLAGSTEHRADGVRVGRYVLWCDERRAFVALHTYANERSASGALMFGLVPGAGEASDRSRSRVFGVDSPPGAGTGNPHEGDVSYGVHGEG